MLGFKLYLITDRKLIADSYKLFAAVEEALKGGVKAIQLREKDLEIRELLQMAYKMREITKKYKAKLFINDRVDIALAVGADGVHLGQQSVPAYAARKITEQLCFEGRQRAMNIIPPRPPLAKGGRGDFMSKDKFLIGVSTHSVKEALEAEKSGADFITLGPVYKTPSKLKYGRPIGSDTLRNVKSKISIPVFAIGGIKEDKVKEVMGAGADGIALISGILGAKNVGEKTREFFKLL
ncbi:MAG: thiamine phosphate synthase [Thermodesulfovibrionales bacterium]|nr:thiamine phosphate synthase [Thermodesulfovibrionales bacterium]